MTKEEIIHKILEVEWGMLVSVSAIDDPFLCRENPETFIIMRTAQHLTWSEDTLKSYLSDLKEARHERLNLIAERYAYMMQTTHPREFENIRGSIRITEAEKLELIGQIMDIFKIWDEEIDRYFPNLRSYGRTTRDDSNAWASIETYIKCELRTYSEQTLLLCLRDVRAARTAGINLSELNLRHMAKLYGFESLESMENLSV